MQVELSNAHLSNIKSGAQYFVIDGFMHNGNQPLLYSTDGQSRMVVDINGNDQVHFVWPEVSEETSLRLINPVASMHTISTLTEKYLRITPATILNMSSLRTRT